MKNKNKLKIAVLLGGTSAEREVSIASGLQIAEALQNKGYDVIPIDTAGGLKKIDVSKGFDVGLIPPESKSLSKLDDRYLSVKLNSGELQDVDVVFIGLHGGHGEDGTIQALLNLGGVSFTGSDVLASAAAMDKAFSKMIFKSQGIPTPEWIAFQRDALKNVKETVKRIETEIGIPAVIKPNAQGSTVGLSIVKSKNRIEEALRTAFEYDNKVLVETYIYGRELTVAVVGNYDLPVIEIVPEGGLYDYKCKYTSGKSKYFCPADIPKRVAEKCIFYGRQAFEILGCRDYGRVDFRLDNDNSLYCLEVNTLPGMTPTSLVPKAMKAIGYDFDDLIDIIVKMALERKNE
ncbi:MAG: D-alanine--D-alanine ligase [candidate division Zixibacteria bacterium]|nr:D-alanine--D-alanine ligase [candidate division Zixibacteria bacterium]